MGLRKATFVGCRFHFKEFLTNLPSAYTRGILSTYPAAARANKSFLGLKSWTVTGPGGNRGKKKHDGTKENTVWDELKALKVISLSDLRLRTQLSVSRLIVSDARTPSTLHGSRSFFTLASRRVPSPLDEFFLRACFVAALFDIPSYKDRSARLSCLRI